MKSSIKEKKPYYLIIARKVIFWLVTIMLGIAVLLLFTRKDANQRKNYLYNGTINRYVVCLTNSTIY